MKKPRVKNLVQLSLKRDNTQGFLSTSVFFVTGPIAIIIHSFEYHYKGKIMKNNGLCEMISAYLMTLRKFGSLVIEYLGEIETTFESASGLPP
jgi:hypothetical protein